MSSSPRVSARAAVAGNPSDGYGGAVCSVVVPFFHAEAMVVAPDDGQTDSLLQATLRRFGEEVVPVPDVGLAFTTSIPRSVGLAGSSAIVIAAIHALCNHTNHQLAPDDVASLAYAIERVDLRIAGGWQDQIMQSRGRSGLMEFGERPTHRPLNIVADPPIPLYVAWSDRASEPSGSSHEVLRSRSNEIGAETETLAALARQAAEGLESRDIHGLKEAIDATYDIRRQIMPIAPAHADMVDRARSLGASANFAGSGGTILGVLPKDDTRFSAEMLSFGYQVRSWNAA